MPTILLGLLLLVPALSAALEPVQVQYPQVRPGAKLAFPRDFGSHPAYRIEWWYVTGHLRTGDGENLGFQVTFFRNRPPRRWNNPSAFNPSQLLFAHAALSDPKSGRILHGQKAARAGLGLAQAREGDTDVRIDDWTLWREGRLYRARVHGEGFGLDLTLEPTQRPLLHGEAGYSRKLSSPPVASYYYSLPQLKVTGSVSRKGRTERVEGVAWLDQEWSSDLGFPELTGWDWTGINLDDGGALMAFRIRGGEDGTKWAGGTYRAPDGRTVIFSPDRVSWTPVRRWKSPHTGIDYPVEWELRVPGFTLLLRPIMDDQEMDVRASTNVIYWEGAVLAESSGRTVGRGYVELTGYGAPGESVVSGP
jgi:predicted secreted hydrolase